MKTEENIGNTVLRRLKKWIRKSKISARDSLSREERALSSAEIVRKISCSEHFKKAETVMIYRAVRGEVLLEGLENAPGAENKRFVYPKCVSKTDMIALMPKNADAWKPGIFGIPEPDPELSFQIPAHEIDLIICPCAAFDGKCRRIGMGGGYYDRFLPSCPQAHIAAAAFECQRALFVPSLPWDKKMDYVITEKNIYFPTEDKSAAK